MTALLGPEVRALLRARRTRLAAGLLLYALLAAPFLLTNPPPHVAKAAAQWFSGDPAFALFLFVWTDLALNKLAAIVGVVLAGGIVREEQARGLLPLLWAKPITPTRYFLVKLAAAALVFALLFAAAALFGLLLFPWRVAGFQPLAFLVVSAVHLLGALFAVVLSATVAVLIPRRLTAMLTSFVVLMLLVGSAFIGFYNPAWAGWAAVNPFYHAVWLLGHLDALTVAVVLRPVAILLLVHAAIAGAGVLAVRRVEA
jgi:ABC-2 type transport system permease protein